MFIKLYFSLLSIINSNMCSIGSSQSPINIKEPYKYDFANLKMMYHKSNLTTIVYNTGLYPKFLPKYSYLEFNKTNYFLKSFHFHTESEHLLRYNRYPLEMHIVNEDINKNKLIFAILFDINKYSSGIFLKNIGWGSYVKNLPLPNCNTHLCNKNDNISDYHYQKIHINPIQMNYINTVVNDNNFYYYNGSTTTYPCMENTKWLVMDKIIPITMEQYQYYLKMPRFYYKNNRKIQPINNRTIYKLIKINNI